MDDEAQARALEPNEGGRTPALALTAYAGDSDIKRVITAGFCKHITKMTGRDENQ